jgi:lipid-binding SYLF domain-containing protein
LLRVPADILARASCIIVLPAVTKVGFIVGGSDGRGAMSCRGTLAFRGIGHDATVAAGPRGAASAGTVGGADIATYGRTKGLFAGTSRTGADNDARQRLYGKAITGREIVLQNAVQPTPENAKARKHTN